MSRDEDDEGQSKFFARNDANRMGDKALTNYPQFFIDMQETTDAVVALVQTYLKTPSYCDPRAGNGKGRKPCMSIKPKHPTWPGRKTKEKFYSELGDIITAGGYTYKVVPKTNRIQIS